LRLRRWQAWCFAALLGGLPLLVGTSTGFLAIGAAFYRVGALVFGGGHVVLPLLQQTFVSTGWLSPEYFLAGYGAAQAVPGPLFAVAAFLGAGIHGAGFSGATIAILGIFLPGLLAYIAADCRDLVCGLKLRGADVELRGRHDKS
jgi:chromate transporter